MKAQEVVKKALSDIEKGKIDESIYAEDLIFSGPMPEPLNRDQYISLLKKITGAVPNFNFHARDFSVRGDLVKFVVGITGTQTMTMQALMPGMQDLPPTNKRFILPQEHMMLRVRGNRIFTIHSDVTAGGGVMGMLSQLGVLVPLEKAA